MDFDLVDGGDYYNYKGDKNSWYLIPFHIDAVGFNVLGVLGFVASIFLSILRGLVAQAFVWCQNR